jgi:nuclear pore complex protein Nup43
VFDLRQPLFPAAYLTAHTSAICEIAFHKEPNKLFTASESGELWQWAQNTTPSLMDYDVDAGNPWLNSERAKSKINVSVALPEKDVLSISFLPFQVTSLISGIRKSINTFDTHRSKIICGSDNEAIYLIENLF